MRAGRVLGKGVGERKREERKKQGGIRNFYDLRIKEKRKEKKNSLNLYSKKEIGYL